MTKANIDSNFDYKSRESYWYNYWNKNGFFKSTPDERESYTIVIPPPNVTGVLHMGHMLNNTLQDVLIRRARMRGYNACWVPGTDHASIATEAKVVAKLKAEGLDKFELGREVFLKHAWEWTFKHGGIIQEQLKKLGCSFDWDREAFTMDDIRSESVLRVFIHLYEKSLIYRGYRMVNWDPEAKTTLSDEEVIYKEVQGKLYFLRYAISGTDQYLVVATTRPETILGDVAVCVNPNDERFSNLVGKKVVVPVANREIPIIADEYVDMEFGTGCLKITPAHDENDYAIGQKHDLEILDILNEDGSLNQLGLHYAGQDRFEVRRKIAQELEEKGFLEKVEDYTNKVGTSERTGAVIEPRLSDQWFLKMKDLAEPALKAVMDENPEVELIPEKFKNTYKHWMENVIDWNISRQLWWGHQIPAYYIRGNKNDVVVALHKEEALQKAISKTGDSSLKLEDLTQDSDVLDTWFSSWIWPLAVFDGIRNPENEEVNYYYPTRDLVTAPEILFFWVARMIMAGYEFHGAKPFDKVYLTGIVRDKQGRKMSKSLGNSPDPIALMEEYSTDGVRVGMLLTSPAGNDLPFDEELCAQGRNFSNKIWNALRLVKSWEVEDLPESTSSKMALQWFDARYNQVLESLEKSFEEYRISEALMTLYKFIWDDFCSWLLEALKPEYGKPISADTYEKLTNYFENLMVLLHPFMPFITEEIWQLLEERAEGSSIGLVQWPTRKDYDIAFIDSFTQFQNVVIAVRKLRAEKGISPKELIKLYAPDSAALSENWFELAKKMGHLESIELGEPSERAVGFSFLAGKYEFFVPAENLVDVEEERKKIEGELENHRGFLKSVEKKLSNESIVNNAPEAVVANEKNKRDDAQNKIAALEKALQSLN